MTEQVLNSQTEQAAHDGNNFVSQTEFAEIIGKTKGYVSQLKAAQRLVFNDAGKVDVVASLAKIEATRDPNRDDAVARHAAARVGGSSVPEAPGVDEQDQQPKGGGELDLASGEMVDFQTARAIKENYLALQAKIDYEERTGKLVDAETVSMKQYEMARQIRDSMMAIPSRIAEQLASETDASACAHLLIDEIRQALEAAAKLAGEMDDEMHQDGAA